MLTSTATDSKASEELLNFNADQHKADDNQNVGRVVYDRDGRHEFSLYFPGLRHTLL